MLTHKGFHGLIEIHIFCIVYMQAGDQDSKI